VGLRHLLGLAYRTKDTPMLYFSWMGVVGIVVSTMTLWIMPGSHDLGMLMINVLGIAGSIVGGLMARLFSKSAEGAVLYPAGIMLSVIGALLLLYEWNFFVGQPVNVMRCCNLQ